MHWPCLKLRKRKERNALSCQGGAIPPIKDELRRKKSCCRFLLGDATLFWGGSLNNTTYEEEKKEEREAYKPFEAGVLKGGKSSSRLGGGTSV